MPELIRFSFVYRTTDGKVWGSHLHAPDWESALDAVSDFQGYQCGATGAVINVDSGETEFDADPPDCPAHLRNHPAGRLSLS